MTCFGFIVLQAAKSLSAFGTWPVCPHWNEKDSIFIGKLCQIWFLKYLTLVLRFAAESGTACTSVQHISNIQHIQGGAADLSQSRTLSMVWHFIDLDLLERRLNTRDLFPSLIGSYFLFLHLLADFRYLFKQPLEKIISIAVWDFDTHYFFVDLVFSLHVKEFERKIRERHMSIHAWRGLHAPTNILPIFKDSLCYDLPLCALILYGFLLRKIYN